MRSISIAQNKPVNNDASPRGGFNQISNSKDKMFYKDLYK
jgi:hypothetical protein